MFMLPPWLRPMSVMFDYYLVLDFEATCDRNIKLKPQEIIEFPVIKVNGKNFEIESEFHEYVQPRIHKKLTPFCIELTGITQDMIENKKYLEDILKEFQLWMEKEILIHSNVKFAFVTCGDWDLKTMLPSQCKYFNISYPKYMTSWINIKKSFAELFGLEKQKGLVEMLKHLNLSFRGRHHSGIGNEQICDVLEMK